MISSNTLEIPSLLLSTQNDSCSDPAFILEKLRILRNYCLSFPGSAPDQPVPASASTTPSFVVRKQQVRLYTSSTSQDGGSSQVIKLLYERYVQATAEKSLDRNDLSGGGNDAEMQNSTGEDVHDESTGYDGDFQMGDGEGFAGNRGDIEMRDGTGQDVSLSKNQKKCKRSGSNDQPTRNSSRIKDHLTQKPLAKPLVIETRQKVKRKSNKSQAEVDDNDDEPVDDNPDNNPAICTDVLAIKVEMEHKVAAFKSPVRDFSIKTSRKHVPAETLHLYQVDGTKILRVLPLYDSFDIYYSELEDHDEEEVLQILKGQFLSMKNQQPQWFYAA
ncbi:hypothetical protein BT96DRAFT_944957 [Gymnopus androsaceus JB14]|uniref:Uncharacterized protein n=1 Tax=Gymnopus androsaceus JB14 TaxID=1447944 RepID=A0A6A4H434_9AGAR|nr:hypothetical protein BT96DRAFT_944957 [Gymnopus androsaceus JB14]